KRMLEVKEDEFDDFEFTPDDKILLVTTADGKSLIGFDTSNFSQLWQINKDAKIVDLEISPDGLKAFITYGHTIEVVNPKTGRSLYSYVNQKFYAQDNVDIDFSQDSKKLLIRIDAIEIHDIDAKKLAYKIPARSPDHSVVDIMFNPNG